MTVSTTPSATQLSRTTARRPIVVVADGRRHPYHDFAPESDKWMRAGFEVRIEDCRTEKDLINVSSEADAVAFWSIDLPLTTDVIDSLEHCRLIVRYGTGIDSVDVEAAARKGILVGTPAGYCTEEVAAHATALILALARRLPFLDRQLRNSGWRAESALTRGVQRLSEQTLGLVGYGRIAQQVARNMQAMIGSTLAYDPYLEPQEAKHSPNVQFVTLEHLLQSSDFVSIHAPLTPATFHLIGTEELTMMKPTAFLINTSRGSVVNEAALEAALRNGVLTGAALDVYEVTPLPSDSSLRDLENVVLTPHFAANSDQAKTQLHNEVATMVEDVLLGRTPVGQFHGAHLSS